MSNKVFENNNDIDNNQNTEKNSKKDSIDQTENTDNSKKLESTEEHDIPKNTYDENVQKNSEDKENIQNIENTENTLTNQTDEQMQQNQLAKSTLGKNRHITTNEERKILSEALPEYLKLPNRTTDRQNKERNVAKKLKSLSPECNQYWNYKKVRDWFNNNNPDKRIKNQEIENQHIMKKAVFVPGSAPMRLFTTETSNNGSFIQENQRITDINNQAFTQYLSNQNHSQFIKCYNTNQNTPTSAILSLNSNSNFFPTVQEVERTSYSEKNIPCYNNLESSAQKCNGENIQNTSYSTKNISSIMPNDITKKEENSEPSPSNSLQVQQQLQLPQVQIHQQQIQLQPQLHQQTQVIQPQINQTLIQPPQQNQSLQMPKIQQIQPLPIQNPSINQQQIQQSPTQLSPKISPNPLINQQQIQQSPTQLSPKISPNPLINQPQIYQSSIKPPQLQQLQSNPNQIHQPSPKLQQIQTQPIQSPQLQLQQIQPPQLNIHQIPNTQLQSPSTIQPQLQIQHHQYQQPPYLVQQTQIQHQPPLLTQPNSKEDENNLKSPTGQKICAELPKNMLVSKNLPKKKSPFKKAFEKDIERIEDIRRKLDEDQSTPSKQHIDFHPTRFEKYQQEQQQRQLCKMQQIDHTDSSSMPNSFIEFKKNPDSTLLLSSTFKSKTKMKSTNDDSTEPDPLPLVPEEELRTYIDKLKTITLSRINQLLKIIDERKILILKQILNINYENRRKSRRKNQEEENLEYSSSSENETNNKDDEIETVNKETDSSENPFIFTRDSQVEFEQKTEKRMRELIDFYHNKFDNQPIVLTFSIGVTKKSVPPKLLTEQSLIESGEFSPGCKTKNGDSIEDIIKERKCVVNFGRNTNFQNKIHVPKDAQREQNEKVVKFYRGEFERRDTIPLSIYDNPTKIESSIFLNNSDEIFLISYDIQEQTSLFVFNDSFIQTPFKKSNRAKVLCQFPSSLNLTNYVLATDGDKLVYFNVESMNTELIYQITQNEKRGNLLKPLKSESCKSINTFSINMSSFQHNRFLQPHLIVNHNMSNIENAGNKEKVAICATSYGDVLVGKDDYIYFFNREKNDSTFYDSIKLENMKDVSSIAAIEINSGSKGDSEPFSIPLIIVGASDYSTIYAFNGNDHSLVARLVGHTSGISCLYSKGTVLFSGSIDGSIIMWEFRLIPDDQNQEQKEDNQNKNETQNNNKNYTVFAYCSLTLLIHTSPIVAMRQAKLGNIQFLISCDSNLLRSTDINRHNSSFSISIPEEFTINSLKFDRNLGEIDFILSSHDLDKFTDRIGIFSINK